MNRILPVNKDIAIAFPVSLTIDQFRAELDTIKKTGKIYLPINKAPRFLNSVKLFVCYHGELLGYFQILDFERIGKIEEDGKPKWKGQMIITVDPHYHMCEPFLIGNFSTFKWLPHNQYQSKIIEQ